MLHNDVEVRSSQIEGKGLFAKTPISAGTVVWWLDGSEERYSFEDLKKLPDEIQKLMYQEEDHWVLVKDTSERLNHSCDPNLWWEGDGKLVARRDIKTGEELAYDYSTSDIDERSMPPMKCSCGAKNCRGVVTARDMLRPDLQERYKGHLTSWVEKFILGHKDS